jgi:hypothetical protein
MKGVKILGVFFLLSFVWVQTMDATFNSKELVSSKGEKIYVNSLNWGVTDDHQLTCISSSKDKLKKINDTINICKGLQPFIYSFRNDTLKLFFKNKIFYRTKEYFKTIKIEYVTLNIIEYQEIMKKSFKNDGYYSVPKIDTKHWDDMPSPPSR